MKKKVTQQTLTEPEITISTLPLGPTKFFPTFEEFKELSKRVNKQERYNRMLYKYIKDIYTHIRRIEEEMKNGSNQKNV